MSLALTDEHRALADVVASALAAVDVQRAARAALDAAADELPALWKDLTALGVTGLHVPEEFGGQGYGLVELATVVEALGRACTPGPFLPTTLAAGVLAACGGDPLRHEHLPALADGSTIGAVGLHGSLSLSTGRLEGTVAPVLGGGLADLLMLPVGDDLVVLPANTAGVTVTPLDSLDPTRRFASVACAGVEVPDGALLAGARVTGLGLGRALAAAEASGIAHACTEMATEYAKTRVQFGRPVGTFQAVKHHCANSRVDAELATAAAWDAARAGTGGPGPDGELASAIAAAQALPAAVRCAQRNIQVHGGVGYTWEHDAHLLLRRASTLLALFDAETGALDDVVGLVRSGVERPVAVDLPPEAEGVRAEVRAFRAELDALPAGERPAALLDSGYALPHYPRPYGRGAGPVEQLVVEEELGDVPGPDLGIGAWILPTLIQHGTPAQQQRWVRPSLEGRLRWCQLFSEPDAGSDAAAIRTRARRVDGGWSITGQKVWTSDAQLASRGLATVRTDPDAPVATDSAPGSSERRTGGNLQRKHAGVSMMVIDMTAAGVEVRPLREITGETLFNEVFLDDVFVPDDDVVGAVGEGWKVARAALGNERVTIGTGRTGQEFSSKGLLDLADRYRPGDGAVARDIARLLAEEQAMRLLNLRQVERAVTGQEPGPEGNVTKLLSAEHAQRVTELALVIAGPAAVSGGEPALARDLLFTRCLSIGGGTSEISRNQIGERLLGLPRDPLLR